MADTNQAWRSDPELQRLTAAVSNVQPHTWKGAWQTNPVNRDYKAANDALISYIQQNGRRLGIPSGMYVSPQTGELYAPDGTPWWKFAALYGGFLAGGLGLQAAVGSAASAGGGSAAALPSSIPATAVSSAAPGVAAGSTVASGTAAGAAGTAAATSTGIASQLKSAMKSPRDLAGLAALIPMLSNMGSGGGSPFDESGVNDEITKSLAMQRGRMEQAQPVYDTLVNMAYGMSPTRYRGGPAPAGYTANAPAKDAYQYQAPRFG